tara:strand:- start:760 stop:906 length:147 start_codon:yes stop_codon:yes gene_type:complete
MKAAASFLQSAKSLAGGLRAVNGAPFYLKDAEVTGKTFLKNPAFIISF